MFKIVECLILLKNIPKYRVKSVKERNTISNVKFKVVFVSFQLNDIACKRAGFATTLVFYFKVEDETM